MVYKNCMLFNVKHKEYGNKYDVNIIKLCREKMIRH